MSSTSAPLQLARKLSEDAQTMSNADARKHAVEAAETIEYLVTLLKECANYIEDFKEYDVPPRFLKAVKEVIPH